MARRPENFNFESVEGEIWTILGTEYRTNPRDLIEDWASHVVQTWAMCRGEMGMTHLPDQGGLNDQAAWMMDALCICTSADSQLRAEEKARGENNG